MKRIKETGDIFFAESDRDWILDGANVHVSMIGFDDGGQTDRVLDGKPAVQINANLTGTVDITAAVRLSQNLNIATQRVGRSTLPRVWRWKLCASQIHTAGPTRTY